MASKLPQVIPAARASAVVIAGIVPDTTGNVGTASHTIHRGPYVPAFPLDDLENKSLIEK